MVSQELPGSATGLTCPPLRMPQAWLTLNVFVELEVLKGFLKKD